MRLDFAELGRACFALLLALLEQKPEQKDAALPNERRPEPELIIRESAGPPLPRGSSPTRAAGT